MPFKDNSLCEMLWQAILFDQDSRKETKSIQTFKLWFDYIVRRWISLGFWASFRLESLKNYAIWTFDEQEQLFAFQAL